MKYDRFSRLLSHTCSQWRKYKSTNMLGYYHQHIFEVHKQLFHKWETCMNFTGLCAFIKQHSYLQVLPMYKRRTALKKKKSCFFLSDKRAWNNRLTSLPLRVIPVRLLHVRIQTAPSINGRPKINVAWKLCSETVTAQFQVWPSENGGVRWKNYFMPCTKANNTVQRDFQLIFLYMK